MSTGAISIPDVLGRPAVHPFPARMAPNLILRALSQLEKPSVVLDPMAGSGTVLAIAQANGHRVMGLDVDPLAVLLSRVWTRRIDASTLRGRAKKILANAKKALQTLSLRDAYPLGADHETRAFVRYWFDNVSRLQLAALANEITRTRNTEMREVLWCAFSRLIIAKQAGVSLALDLAHSRPHKAFARAPRRPFDIFLDAVARVTAGCVTGMNGDHQPATICKGDVRAMPFQSGTVDLVFTSPPYLNAIDYLRCSKFSLVWMGHSTAELRKIRSTSIGTEVGTADGDLHTSVVKQLRLRPALSRRMDSIVRRYIHDTAQSLREVARVLKPHGRAVYVVGENTIRGTYVPTGRLVTLVASTVGLRLVERRYRRLPANRRYLPPPGSGGKELDTRMRREVILTFERV